MSYELLYFRTYYETLGFAELTQELAIELRGYGKILQPVYPPPSVPHSGGGIPDEIVIALLTGGVIATALDKIVDLLRSHLDRYRDNEITISREGNTITIHGRSEIEELELIKTFFPEFLEANTEEE